MVQHPPTFRSHVTLVLSTVLHSFTHAYGSMLVPLYYMMELDLKLPGVKAASLVVTVYGAVYCLGSYAGGVLADRTDRKWLLGIGLLGNAAAIFGMGLTHSYPLILLLGIIAGLFGTLFHPTANALAPAHYPRSPGMAIGLLGIGSGLGFFVGPQFAGWRAQSARWHWGSISQWQKPCIELGVAGLVAGVLFLIFAAEAADSRHGAGGRPPDRMPLGRIMRRRVLAVAGVLAFRDFAGVAGLSLASLYLLKACGKSVQETGLIVGLMMLLGVVVNPLAVYLSSGRRRLVTLSLMLVVGGIVVITTPLWPVRLVLVVLCGFQSLQLGSYAVSDAAMLERVDPQIRGRVVGLFLVIAGTFGATGPWIMGWWVDRLKGHAAEQSAYAGPFGLLGVFMIVASLSPLVLRKLGPTPGISSIAISGEITPRTMEMVP